MQTNFEAYRELHDRCQESADSWEKANVPIRKTDLRNGEVGCPSIHRPLSKQTPTKDDLARRGAQYADCASLWTYPEAEVRECEDRKWGIWRMNKCE
jgi:hypothetical protein